MKKLIIIILFMIVSFASAMAITTNATEQIFLKAGLVDIKTIDPSIHVELVNSHASKNFFKKDYYDGLEKAYLLKDVAKKLSIAQKILKKKYPKYSLSIMDAARPNSVSWKMYDDVKGTAFEKYVANPKSGSMHNYGAAIDLTIVDEKGKRIDMGLIPFYKGRLGVKIAYVWEEKVRGGISENAKKNRKLLKDVMLEAGFYPLNFEWWHFNGFKKKYIRENYQMIK